MEGRLKLVESGVANFRDHQKFMGDFVIRHEEREGARDKKDRSRAKIHFALLGGLIALIVGCALALFSWVLDGHHVVANSDLHSQTTYDAAIPKVR